MPISSNNTHISFNNNSTQNTAFLGSIAAANITGQITAPQIAPGVVPAAGMTGQIFASATPGPSSWTAPPTTTRIKVTVVGGGGGAGPGLWNYPGGAGGGTAIRSIPVVGGTPYPYTVGAGGPATGAGGTTSFGSPASVSATGGAAGTGTCGTVVSGGSGSGGDINLVGDQAFLVQIGAIPGNPGGCPPTPPSPFGVGSGGGGSFLAARKFTAGVGNPFGGGGSGNLPPGTGYAGGPGGIIIEF